MINDLFKVIDEDNILFGKYVCIIESLKNNMVNIEELSLSGLTVKPFSTINKKYLEKTINIPLTWKAAHAVWKNNVLNEEISCKKSSKQKKKIIELLAQKYNVNKNILTKIINELEESNFL